MCIYFIFELLIRTFVSVIAWHSWANEIYWAQLSGFLLSEVVHFFSPLLLSPERIFGKVVAPTTLDFNVLVMVNWKSILHISTNEKNHRQHGITAPNFSSLVVWIYQRALSIIWGHSHCGLYDQTFCYLPKEQLPFATFHQTRFGGKGMSYCTAFIPSLWADADGP